MEAKVLVVQDDLALGRLLQEWLAREGYHALVSTSGKDALRQFHDQHPSVVLLDTGIPYLSAWDVLRHIREADEIAVIVVTGTAATADIVKALNMGADDYVVKPFERQVLLAKMRAVSRRYPDEFTRHNAIFRWNGIEVDFLGHRVLVEGRQVNLSPTEFRLLSYLVKNAGRVVGHQQLLLNVWGSSYINGKEYLKLYIRYLRLKLEREPENPQYIKTIRGIGYCFDATRPELAIAAVV